jgi:hypothetical protein
MADKRSYTDRTLKLLFARAAFCAFPGCRTPLTDRPNGRDAVVAQIAHIAGLNPDAARHDRSMTSAERNDYSNLILLCPTHHLAYSDAYTLEEVRMWKSEQERWINERMRKEMPHVTFAELEVVMKAVVAQQPGAPTQDLTLVPPALKMAKNAITSSSGVTMGLTKVAEVRDLIQRLAALDASLPERLHAGFVTEYERLHMDGNRGDDLFLSLRVFAANGIDNVRMQDAALAVLTYLFEACEVFER